MPRSQTSAAGRIVDFFRSAPLETAELILGLCRDAVNGRKAKSSAAKERATHGTRPTPAVMTNFVAPKVRKARKKRVAAKKLKQAPLPGTTATSADVEAEAGDLVGAGR